MRSRLLRTTLRALALLALVPSFSTLAHASGGEVKIVRIWPEYREADSFTRIAEYFGGKEKTRELLVRSQPASRDGYYFLTRFETPVARPGTILALEYILPGEELARLQFFPVDLPQGSRAVLAGLTGADWPSASAEPTAWRLRLLAADGAELARQQSFLWSLPPAGSSADAPSEPTPTPAG
jgi:hypothetical protein